MLKLLLLLLAPNGTWEKIAKANRGMIVVLLLNPLPLLAIGLAAEAYCLMNLGDFGLTVERLKPMIVSKPVVIRYVEAHAIGSLVTLLLGAKLFQWIIESFHCRAHFTPPFTVMAYSMGPLLLARALDGVPQLDTWLCWGIGAALSLHLLYHGVGQVLQPDATKGFGLFLSGAIVLLMLSGLAHYMAVRLLHPGQ